MPAKKEVKSCCLQVKEIFAESSSTTEVFAELILTEHRNVTKRHWTESQSQAIMKLSTVEDGRTHLQS